MKPKLLLTSPLLDDANSAWRAMGPMSKLREHLDIVPVKSGELKWHDFLMADLFWSSRPFMQQHVQFSVMARNLGIPVISEIDDDLLHVPSDNPTYYNYNHPQHQVGVRQCHILADLLFVSTDHLHKIYGPYANKMVTVPNAYDDRFFSFRIKDRKTKRIAYRGSDSHVRDMTNFQKEILSVYTERPDWQWDFYGYRPWFLADRMQERARFHGGFEFIQYFKMASEVNADIMIVPLDDNIFNRSKSNIAALEGCVMGAVPLVPDWDEWNYLPGAVVYKNPTDFKNKLIDMMNMSELELIERRNKLKVFFETERSLDKVNEIRLKHILELYESKKRK